MKEQVRKFMTGRYGGDELGRFLNIISLIILLTGILTIQGIAYVGLALMIYEYYRMFSKNIQHRLKENAVYLRYKNRILGWFAGRKKRFEQRNTHRFYKCPSCHKTLRIPKGKGKIEITCPICHTHFDKSS